MLREQNQDSLDDFEPGVRAGDLLALSLAVRRCKFERRIPGWLAAAILSALNRLADVPDKRGRLPTPQRRYEADLRRAVRAELAAWALRLNKEAHRGTTLSAFELAREALQGSEFAARSAKTIEREYRKAARARPRINLLHLLRATNEPIRRLHRRLGIPEPAVGPGAR